MRYIFRLHKYFDLISLTFERIDFSKYFNENSQFKVSRLFQNQLCWSHKADVAPQELKCANHLWLTQRRVQC